MKRMNTPRSKSRNDIDCTCPVSYTHLDVYKRQTLCILRLRAWYSTIVDTFNEYRVCVKFYLKFGKTAVETQQQAFGGESMGQIHTYMVLSDLKNDMTTVKGKKHSRHP